jgi:RND superfamily putative drug exporter
VGRIISSAALLLTITLLSFANGLSFMKMFGIGTALAIVIDATVIRGVVVPAFLRVAGDLNWWAPRPLKWLHARIGFSETPSHTEIPPVAPEHDEVTQRLRPIQAPEPDTVRYPRPTPRQDDETQRFPTIHPPEPDTVRHPRPTPGQDEETQRLARIRTPEPDTVRHEPDTVRHATPGVPGDVAADPGSSDQLSDDTTIRQRPRH